MSLTGAAGVTLVQTRTGEDKTSGPFIEYVYEGTQDAIAGAVSGVLDADFYSWGRSGNGIKFQLTARYNNHETIGTTETATREERLHWNRITRSLYEHPYFTATLSVEEIAITRKAVEARTPHPDPIAIEQGELYDLAMKGVESTRENQPMVIVTETATNLAILSATFTNVGEIYTRAQMIAELGLTSHWKDILPQDADIANFDYGYQKSPPEYIITGGNKKQLVRTFEYGLWPTVIFTSKT